jgi:hypothetical protein
MRAGGITEHSAEQEREATHFATLTERGGREHASSGQV